MRQERLPDLSKYAGEWVVIIKNKVAAHSQRLKELENTINSSKSIPTVMLVPRGETIILHL